jgi:hypothetical protein
MTIFATFAAAGALNWSKNYKSLRNFFASLARESGKLKTQIA